ncbi:MAG: sodium:proline symporter [Candidatus Hydrogenedentota bacterium]
MSIVIVGIVLYIALQLGIGAWVSRKMLNEEAYLVAGRSLGYVMATMTIFATWFGSESCIGSAGVIYEEGLAGGRADPFGYALCILILGGFFAVRLWNQKLTTIGDLFRRRYGVGVEKFAVLLIVPTSVLWASAQVLAFGHILATATDIPLEITLAAAAAVVIAYTTMGGMLADAYTDLIQGIVLVVGIAILFFVVVTQHVTKEVVEVALVPERLTWFGGNDESIWATIEAWSIPILGSLFAQELIARMVSSRSAQVAKRSAIIAGIAYIGIGLMPLTLGLLGPGLVPGLDDGEQILPVLAKQHLNSFVYVIFTGALISAILSTVDSALLAASSLVSHNIVVGALKITDEKLKVRAARIVVVAFGIMAYLLAIGDQSVRDLVEMASAFGSSGVFIAVVFAFQNRFGGRISAFAALLVGVVAWAVGTWVEAPYPYIMSVAVAFAAFACAAVFEWKLAPMEQLIPEQSED